MQVPLFTVLEKYDGTHITVSYLHTLVLKLYFFGMIF